MKQDYIPYSEEQFKMDLIKSKVLTKWIILLILGAIPQSIFLFISGVSMASHTPSFNIINIIKNLPLGMLFMSPLLVLTLYTYMKVNKGHLNKKFLIFSIISTLIISDLMAPAFTGFGIIFFILNQI